MTKKTITKSAKVSKKKSRTETSNKGTRSKIQRIKKFFKGKSEYIPGILASAAMAYILHGIYNRNQLHRGLIRYHLIHKVNPYEKLDIKSDSTLENVKKTLHKCYLEMHPDRAKDRYSREKFEFCTHLRDFLRSEGLKV